MSVDFVWFTWLCLAEAVASFAGARDDDVRPGVLIRVD
jgi:hypothetical protein